MKLVRKRTQTIIFYPLTLYTQALIILTIPPKSAKIPLLPLYFLPLLSGCFSLMLSKICFQKENFPPSPDTPGILSTAYL